MTDTTTAPAVSQPKTIEVDLNELRQKKLMIATPMYGGQCYGQYTRSLFETAAKATRMGISIQPYFMYNESLIQRARNYCVDHFMRSDCTHLLFIDADIHWQVDELLMMLSVMNDDNDHDIVCGPYPKKEISWEKVARAVEKGEAAADPTNLKNFVGDYVFNIQGTQAIDLREMFEVSEAGTGFMMIKRSVFETIQKKYPKRFYKPDHARTVDFDGSREIYLHFDCQIDPTSKRYLSEDYYFCRNARKAGHKIWLAPWVKLSHTGTYEFGGTVYHLARVGSDFTATDYNKGKA